MLRIIRFVPLVLVLLCGCIKDDPAPVQPYAGGNYFTCTVNGAFWKAKGVSTLGGSLPALTGGFEAEENYGDGDSNKVWLLARNEGKSAIHLFVNAVDTPGVYQLYQNTPIRPGALIAKDYGMYSEGKKTYVTNPAAIGWVRFSSLVRFGNRMAGTFAFKAKASDGSMVDITDGKFSYDYKKEQ